MSAVAAAAVVTKTAGGTTGVSCFVSGLLPLSSMVIATVGTHRI